MLQENWGQLDCFTSITYYFDFSYVGINQLKTTFKLENVIFISKDLILSLLEIQQFVAIIPETLVFKWQTCNNT